MHAEWLKIFNNNALDAARFLFGKRIGAWSMKVMVRICVASAILLLIGLLLLIFQPKGCSPFIGVGVVGLGFVLALCALVFWHFIRYD